MINALLTWLGITLLFLLFKGDFKLFHAIIPAFAVYMIPFLGLREKAKRRRALIDRNTPYLLDLITLTMNRLIASTASACTVVGVRDRPVFRPVVRKRGV